MADAFKISTNSVQVLSQADPPLKAVLKANSIKSVDGKLLFHVKPQDFVVQRMLSCRCGLPARDSYKVMPRTSIVDELMQAQASRVKSLIQEGTHSGAKRMRYDKKMYTDKKLRLPDLIEAAHVCTRSAHEPYSCCHARCFKTTCVFDLLDADRS